MPAFSRAMRRRRPISCALISFRSAITSSNRPALDEAVLSLGVDKTAPFHGMLQQQRPQVVAGFRFRRADGARDLKNVQSQCCVRQLGHIGQLLEMSRTDAAVLYHRMAL